MKKLLNPPSKEDILQYYINENHSMAEAAAFFGISVTQFGRYKKQYGILKPLQLRGEHSKSAQVKRFESSIPAKEQIELAYIVEKRSIEDLAQYYGVSRDLALRWLKHYGIKKTQAQIEETKQRRSLDTYGDPMYFHKKAAESSRMAIKEKYGVNSSYQIPSVLAYSPKRKKELPDYDDFYGFYIIDNHSLDECAEKYGVSRPTIIKWVRAFGLANKKSRSEIMEITKKTCQKLYGCDYAANADSTKQRRVDACMAKYGVPYTPMIGLDNYDILSTKENLSAWLERYKSENGKYPTRYDAKDALGISVQCLDEYIRKYGLKDSIIALSAHSLPEREVEDFIRSVLPEEKIKIGARTVIKPYEIDVYLPNRKFGIEFNGAYWHSDASKKNRDGHDVHRLKSIMAEERGVFLLHVFEHEWTDGFVAGPCEYNRTALESMIAGYLGIGERIAIDECSISAIPAEDAVDFCKKEHLHLASPNIDIAFGIRLNDRLIAVSMYKRSDRKGYQWEYLGYLQSPGLLVEDGACRLFNEFLSGIAQDGDAIYHVQDICKEPKCYMECLGFAHKISYSPSYWWVDLRNKKIFGRFRRQTQRTMEHYRECGCHMLYDSGSALWEFRK